MGNTLGRIETVDPRTIWKHEAHDFTPWLLANADVLGELLGMDLELEESEHPVGGFWLDLIGKDTATDHRVIIENQLEQTDHIHLGQILTYAAGTDPAIIVWVAKEFRDEHRAAIDWLNERTDENTQFFGVEIEVIRIGDSDPAPNFKLVAKPNNWGKTVRAAANMSSSDAERHARRREFWEYMLGEIRQRRPGWTSAKTTSNNWTNLKSGTKDVDFTIQWLQSGVLGCQVWFGSSDEAENLRRFNAVYAQRQAFEEAFGEPVEWDSMEGKKAAKIVISSDFTRNEGWMDNTNRAKWPNMVDWVIETQERLRAALKTIGGIPD